MKTKTKKSTVERCPEPCATCPFLKANFGKLDPPDCDLNKILNKSGDRIYYHWYSEKNLLRLWKEGLRHGEAMICHATDPGADDYGGKSAKPGNERICVGSMVLVMKHIKAIESQFSGNWTAAISAYRKIAGKFAITRNGIHLWCTMIALGRTQLFGGLTVPRSLNQETVNLCGVPYDDKIVNGE